MMSLASGEERVIWKKEDEALEILRDPSLVPAVDDSLFTHLFGKGQMSRKQCLII